jgi:hypothetical protein
LQSCDTCAPQFPIDLTFAFCYAENTPDRPARTKARKQSLSQGSSTRASGRSSRGSRPKVSMANLSESDVNEGDDYSEEEEAPRRPVRRGGASKRARSELSRPCFVEKTAIVLYSQSFPFSAPDNVQASPPSRSERQRGLDRSRMETLTSFLNWSHGQLLTSNLLPKCSRVSWSTLPSSTRTDCSQLLSSNRCLTSKICISPRSSRPWTFAPSRRNEANTTSPSKSFRMISS